VVVNGLLLDDKGEKMSKTKGNVVEPFETIATHGADPVRWYIMSNAPPWENLKWSERGLVDSKRKFYGTLTNIYNFFATYANIDGFDPNVSFVPVAERPEMDRWIRSRVESTIATVDAAFDVYHPTRAARAVEALADDLSNWYIRRSRRRFWKSGDVPDKAAAYHTTHECLERISRLIAPISPFYADWLFQAITQCGDHESVHLASFPVADPGLIDEALEKRMELGRMVASTALAIRNRVNINVRQPLQRILVVTSGRVNEQSLDQMRTVILDEVNVRVLEYISSSSGIVDKTARPNFKVLGRRLGPLMKAVNGAVRAMSADDIESFESEGAFTFDIDGEDVVLRSGDLEITSQGIEGWQVEQVEDVTVALDTTITRALKLDGLAREFTNRVQNMRKSAEFNVVDRIAIAFNGSDEMVAALAEHGDWIRNETLAEELERSDAPEGEQIEKFDIGSEHATIGVRRVR